MLDLLLALILLLILPARALWRSRRKRRKSDKAKQPRLRMYCKSLAVIGVLLAVLALACWQSGRPATALGLGLPLSTIEIWGLVATALLLVGLGVAEALSNRKLTPEERAKHEATMDSDESLPGTPAEFRLYVVLALAIGIGWELLYRGFLVGYLTPHIGLAGAVALPALAYGAAHGYTSAKQFGLSILSAFLFTIGFVLTSSLWWLMLIHAGVGLMGGISAYRMPKAPTGVPA